MSKRTKRTIDSVALMLVAAGVGSCSVVWDSTPDGGRPAQLQSYIDEHYRELGDRFVQPMPRDEFARRLRESRVLFLGDHHRDAKLHRQMLELIDWVCDLGHRPVIGIEAIGSQDNPSLQEFLTGGIDFDVLRRRVAQRWPQSWLDNADVDRDFFRALLVRARERRLDAFPLEPTPRLALRHRDSVIAKNVRRALRLYPDRLIIVVVGHAHLLGDGHLTGRVGAKNVSVAARLSPALEKAFAQTPPAKDKSFLRTDRDILFFPEVTEGKLSDS